MTTDNVQLPPHDLDAEEATLGSILIDPNAIERIKSWLQPSMFYRDANRWIYSACKEIHEAGTPINQVTAAYHLVKNHQLEAAGGGHYLGHVIDAIPTSVHVEHYARIVQDCYHRRQLIEVGLKISKLGYQTADEYGTLLAKAQEWLNGIKNGHDIPKPFSYKVKYE